jgi:hypothetical protein
MEMKDAVQYVNEKHRAMSGASHDGINIMFA